MDRRLNDMNRDPAPRRASAGFTLVETMVAILVGMLVTFIVMQVYATSEGAKRTITGGADAQSDAAVALYLIERDLRQAGYGLAPNTEDFVPIYTAPNNGGVLTNGVLGQCTSVRAYNANRATTHAFVYTDFTFAPVVINPTGYPAGDAGTDLVLINYGTSSGVTGKGVVFSTVSDAGADNVLSFRLTQAGTPDPRSGFVPGDMYLAVPNAGGACTIGEVTGLPGDGVAACIASLTLPPQNWWPIQRNDAGYASAYKACAAASATAAWNETGGGAVDYTTGGKLYDLGPAGAFVSRVYAVRNSNLTMCDLTKQDCILGDITDPAVWTPMASGVVGFKAQYGKDTNLNGAVNAWDTDPPTLNAVTTTAGAARAQIIAVRLALVVRSGQFEKTVVTTANPTWYGGDFDLTGLGTDWANYRYKTAQSIVPLRDMIWGVQN